MSAWMFFLAEHRTGHCFLYKLFHAPVPAPAPAPVALPRPIMPVNGIRILLGSIAMRNYNGIKQTQTFWGPVGMAPRGFTGKALAAMLLLQESSLAWLPPHHYLSSPRLILRQTCPQRKEVWGVTCRKGASLGLMSRGRKQSVSRRSAGGETSEGKQQDQEEQLDRTPARLKDYDNLDKLVEALAGFYESVDVNGMEASIAMNQIKRLQGQARTESQRNTVEDMMRKFAIIVLEEMETLDSKSIALAINALGLGKGRRRTSLLLNFLHPILSRLHHDPHNFSSRSIAMLMNAFARNKMSPGNLRGKDDGASKDMADLYRVSSRLMQERFHADADTFSWSMLLNAYASADVYDPQVGPRRLGDLSEAVPQLLDLATKELVMKREAPSPQDLANIVNAYHRFGRGREVMTFVEVYRRSLQWNHLRLVKIAGNHFNLECFLVPSGEDAGFKQVCTHMAEAAMLLPPRKWTKQGASLMINALSRFGIVIDGDRDDGGEYGDGEWIGDEKLKQQVNVKCLFSKSEGSGHRVDLERYDIGYFRRIHGHPKSSAGLARLNHTDFSLVSRMERAAVSLKNQDWSSMDIVNVVDALDRLKLHNTRQESMLTDLCIIWVRRGKGKGGEVLEGGKCKESVSNDDLTCLDRVPVLSSSQDLWNKKLQWSSIGLFALGLTRGEWTSSSHPLLYQKLLEIVQSASFRNADWQEEVVLVEEEDHEKITILQKEDIERLVMSALRGFEGAGMLSSVSDILCREERIAGEAEPLMEGEEGEGGEKEGYDQKEEEEQSDGGNKEVEGKEDETIEEEDEKEGWGHFMDCIASWGNLPSPSRRLLREFLAPTRSTPFSQSCAISFFRSRLAREGCAGGGKERWRRRREEEVDWVEGVLRGNLRMSWAFRQIENGKEREYARRRGEDKGALESSNEEHVSIREAVAMARALSEIKQRDTQLNIFLSRFFRAQDSSSFTADELAILVSSFSRKSVLDGSLYRFFAVLSFQLFFAYTHSSHTGCILQHALSDFSAHNVATILHGYSKAGIWQEEVRCLSRQNMLSNDDSGSDDDDGDDDDDDDDDDDEN
eukprot:754449-Hanusia_phi.AAC.1